jgi:hypothetical protein
MLLLTDFVRYIFVPSSQKVPKECLKTPEISTFVAILLKQKVYKIVQFFTVIYCYFPLSFPNFLNIEKARKRLP